MKVGYKSGGSLIEIIINKYIVVKIKNSIAKSLRLHLE